jgi:hypothetical protein
MFHDPLICSLRPHSGRAFLLSRFFLFVLSLMSSLTQSTARSVSGISNITGLIQAHLAFFLYMAYCAEAKKGKAIPVTDREGPQGCETSKLPHSLDNRLTDGGEVVNLTRRPLFAPKKICGTHFC